MKKWVVLLACLFASSAWSQTTEVVVEFDSPEDAFEALLGCTITEGCEVVEATVLESSSDVDKEATAGATPTTPATTIHGLPANNPGNGGSSASPEGEGVNNGNGIHNIAGGAPGQNDSQTTPADGDDPPACDMHGGLDAYSRECDR